MNTTPETQVVSVPDGSIRDYVDGKIHTEAYNLEQQALRVLDEKVIYSAETVVGVRKRFLKR